MTRIAIIGGTGKEGKGLAYRWALAGHDVIIGSRNIEKAQLAADEVNSALPENAIKVGGLGNIQAADWCEIVTLTVPFSAHISMLEYLKEVVRGKILIDVTVPIVPPKVTIAQMPEAGSAGKEAQKVLGEDTPVVIAFQNISYERLMKDEDIDCDVFVCGTSKEARDVVIGLVEDAGMVGWDAGPMGNAMVIEGLTSVLLYINKRYGSSESGVKVTGVSKRM
ncbi:MAG: NADPH-dependent F420 reductase [Anaerolineaceae bacterium]